MAMPAERHDPARFMRRLYDALHMVAVEIDTRRVALAKDGQL